VPSGVRLMQALFGVHATPIHRIDGLSFQGLASMAGHTTGSYPHDGEAAGDTNSWLLLLMSHSESTVRNSIQAKLRRQ
jgi:hypothetical protein